VAEEEAENGFQAFESFASARLHCQYSNATHRAAAVIEYTSGPSMEMNGGDIASSMAIRYCGPGLSRKPPVNLQMISQKAENKSDTKKDPMK